MGRVGVERWSGDGGGGGGEGVKLGRYREP